MVLKYCNSCLYPHTKPDIWFDEAGKCSACLAFEKRDSIDWEARELEFMKICEQLKKESVGGYDIIVPVSGGKDSHVQVLKCLEYDLNVLAVCARTDDLSELGRKNLDNIAKLGVDVVEVYTNPLVRRKINKYTLETIGDISWAEHITIFTIPFREAVKRNINCILWGENPQNEYGGPDISQEVKSLSNKWLGEFGGLNGLRVKDIIDAKIATDKELIQYVFNNTQYRGNRIESLFMGYFFPWHGEENAKLAFTNGFNYSDNLVSGSGVRYENLDNYQTGIHDYFKYLKFGFGRATDIANNMVRRKKWTRDEARQHILKWDGQPPIFYLGKNLKDVLGDIDVSEDEFVKICHLYANKELFEVDYGHKWLMLKPKFIEDLQNA